MRIGTVSLLILIGGEKSIIRILEIDWPIIIIVIVY